MRLMSPWSLLPCDIAVAKGGPGFAFALKHPVPCECDWKLPSWCVDHPSYCGSQKDSLFCSAQGINMTMAVRVIVWDWMSLNQIKILDV
jgi:hypothetical protein